MAWQTVATEELLQVVRVAGELSGKCGEERFGSANFFVLIAIQNVLLIGSGIALGSYLTFVEHTDDKASF